MNNEFFKKEDVIYSYTDDMAVNDGTIHKLGNSPHRVTNSLLESIKRKYGLDDNNAYQFILNEVLPLVPYAFKKYNEGSILKSNFNFKVGNFKHSEIIWFIPNENNGITAMRPEDY